jgi:hypothetical protein
MLPAMKIFDPLALISHNLNAHHFNPIPPPTWRHPTEAVCIADDSPPWASLHFEPWEIRLMYRFAAALRLNAPQSQTPPARPDAQIEYDPGCVGIELLCTLLGKSGGFGERVDTWEKRQVSEQVQ